MEPKQQSQQTKTELRYCPLVELRAEGEGKETKLVGYAAVFDKPSERMWGWENDFVEYIAPGAFTRTLADKDDVRANVNHRGGMDMLGRTPTTLKLSQDSVGLRAEITPPDTQTGRDVVELVRRGDLKQMSFAFEAREVKFEKAKIKDQPDVRTILDAKLFDVSIVDFPAYPDTSIAVRALEAEFKKASGPDIDMLRRRLRLAVA